MARKADAGDNKRSGRLEMILQLIMERPIGTQKDLQEALAEKGFDVTQATLSRDVRDLKLVKVSAENGEPRYLVPGKTDNQAASSRFFSLFKTSVVRLESALNQVVIHTYTGMAQAVCAALDGLHWNYVLGTIAGDDTILIIMRDEESAKKLVRELRGML